MPPYLLGAKPIGCLQHIPAFMNDGVRNGFMGNKVALIKVANKNTIGIQDQIVFRETKAPKLRLDDLLTQATPNLI